MTREERLRMLRERNATVQSPAVGWLLADIEALEQENARMRDLLIAFAGPADATDPCLLDHEGYCQAHHVSKPCIVAEARRLLETT